jgi:tRNA pseudouridine38-40 synthase
MNRKVLLTIAYCGTNYCGYQVQPNGVTVQEMLNKASEALFGYPCDIVGCSRTDSGVHARGFCATVSKKGEDHLPSKIDVSRIPRALNAHLPVDIAVLRAVDVAPDFHARYDVISKEYEYVFYNGRERNPFFEERAWHIPTPVSDERLAEMQRAAVCWIGKQDFSAFRAVGADTDKQDAVRHVMAASVQREGT